MGRATKGQVTYGQESPLEPFGSSGAGNQWTRPRGNFTTTSYYDVTNPSTMIYLPPQYGDLDFDVVVVLVISLNIL